MPEFIVALFISTFFLPHQHTENKLFVTFRQINRHQMYTLYFKLLFSIYKQYINALCVVLSNNKDILSVIYLSAIITLQNGSGIVPTLYMGMYISETILG